MKVENSELSILTGYFAKCPIKLGNVNNNNRFFIKSPGSFT